MEPGVSPTQNLYHATAYVFYNIFSTVVIAGEIYERVFNHRAVASHVSPRLEEDEFCPQRVFSKVRRVYCIQNDVR